MPQPEISVADMVDVVERGARNSDDPLVAVWFADDSIRLRAAAARLREMQAGEWVRKPVSPKIQFEPPLEWEGK